MKNKKLAMQERCIVMRGGEQIWLSQEEAKQVESVLLGVTGSKFIKVQGQILNSADLKGMFTPVILEETTRRKQGQWQCPKCGKWLQRNEKECIKCKMDGLYPSVKQEG